MELESRVKTLYDAVKGERGEERGGEGRGGEERGGEGRGGEERGGKERSRFARIPKSLSKDTPEIRTLIFF